MELQNKVLTGSFQQFFSVDLATTQEQLKQVYGLRYRVYCDEFKYEREDRFPTREEVDEYDEFSLSCLVIHRKTGKPAACVRVIPATKLSDDRLLPFEKASADTLNRIIMEKLNPERKAICEVSRLAVDSTFRRRSGETHTRLGELDSMDVSHQEKRTFSLLAISVFLAAIATSDISGLHNMFAMMEAFLPRIMSRSGIHFHKIGDEIDYHGVRAPYHAATPDILQTMNPDLKGFYQYIYGCLNHSIKAKLEQ